MNNMMNTIYIIVDIFFGRCKSAVKKTQEVAISKFISNYLVLFFFPSFTRKNPPPNKYLILLP